MTLFRVGDRHVPRAVRFAAAAAAAAAAALLAGAPPASAHHGSLACVSDCAKVPLLFDKQFARPGTGNGPAGQPSEEWDGMASAPDPVFATGFADVREFTVLPGSDTLTAEITWDTAPVPLLYDLDLYIDRQTAFGTWQQVGDGTNGQLAGDGEPNELAIVQRPEPGTYRTRVVNWASTQLAYHGLDDHPFPYRDMADSPFWEG